MSDTDLLGGFTCSKCGKTFYPGPGSYIGPKDRESTECSPFMEWEELCEECHNGADKNDKA